MGKIHIVEVCVWIEPKSHIESGCAFDTASMESAKIRPRNGDET